MMDAMMGTFSNTNQSARITTVQQEVGDFMKEYLNLVMFALIPAYAFFSWRLFKKKGYNYAENFVLHVAIQAQTNTLSFLFMLPAAYFIGNRATVALAVAGLVIMIGAFTIANRQFFKVSWWKAFFKALLIYILAYIVQVLLMTIAIFIILGSKSG